MSLRQNADYFHYNYKMTSKIKLRRLIDDVEVEYKWCWFFLVQLKTGNRDNLLPEELFEFQPKLTIALFKLEEAYQEINKEKKMLIAKKKRLSLNWFSKRMKTLSNYQNALNEIIALGRVIGDSFAWIFYADERQFLGKHFHHEKIPHLPLRIGGKGELEFIKQTKTIDNKLILYHGITSFLRIGDLSLFDLKSKRLVAIGDLKTTKISEFEFLIRCYFVGDAIDVPNNKKIVINAKNEANPKLPQNMQETLKRQLKKMSDCLIPPEIGKTVQIKSNTYLNNLKTLLKELEKKSAAVEKVDNGLLLLAIKDRRRSMFHRFFEESTPNLDKKLKGFNKKLESIADIRFVSKERNKNSFYINSFKPDTFAGRTPFFWWGIDSEHTRKIVFQEISVCTVYNPAFFLEKLESLGFDIKQNGRQIDVKKIIGKRVLELGDIKYFLNLIQNNLFDEHFIISMFESFQSEIKSKNIKSNTEIALDIQQFFE